MTEQLANNAASTLSAAITGTGDTSCTVTNGAVFPSSGNFRILIDSELILVGARSGNTLSSLTRGIESTSAATHSNGAAVTHVLTKGGLDQYLAELYPWQAYTPAWTSSGTAPAIGNSTVNSRYVQIGKTIIAQIYISFGSSATFGTGTYFFSLPVNASTALNTRRMGWFNGYDASANATAMAIALYNSTSTVQMAYPATWPSGTNTAVAATAPWTWAQSDQVHINLVYEAA